jgi:hypothetical protein
VNRVARTRILGSAVGGLGLIVIVIVIVGVGGGAAGATRPSTPASPAAAALRVGHARFEVLSPTMIRLEYSADDRFENRPTLVAQDRQPTAAYTAIRRHGVLTLRTSALVLRYRLGSGPFTKGNVSITPVQGAWQARPSWSSPTGGPRNLGGWVRALDDDTGPVPLHPGLLSRAGWHLLNDSHDVVVTPGSPGFVSRPTGARYQDGYLFGYGHDYRGALRDLRLLTGPAPLLPRSAFGVWFSRYFAYAASDYPKLLHAFRRHRVPLDTLSVDTDWKRQADPLSSTLAGLVLGTTRAYSWNGWEWNRTLFPNPKKFISWAHRHGIDIAVNIHPSIDSTDPRYASTVAKTGPLPIDLSCEIEQIDPLGTCHVFDLTKPAQIAAYEALHAPIRADGVDVWWLDWCCDATTLTAPGLTPDTWFNRLYTTRIDRAGDRWLVLSRVGGSHQGGDSVAGPGPGIYAEHRFAIQFTGDTCATWKMLAFEARLTAEEGNVGLPYVSDDIGSFNGAPKNGQCSPTAGGTHATLPADRYARWVQFGAFQPIERLHSNHGYRLPWEYPHAADVAAADALRLRETLVPTFYTLARQTYDTGLPIVRNLYLSWPGHKAAYHNPSEYTIGNDLLVRPVTAPGNPAPARVWFPPGRWIDYFTGREFRGPSTDRLVVPLDQMPVFVKAGGVVVTQPPVTHTKAAPRDHLVVSVYGKGRGATRLYDDQGVGFGYRHGKFAWTTIRHRRGQLVIGRARGAFPGELSKRAWSVVFHDVARPQAVTVNGQPTHWSYRPGRRLLTIHTAELSIVRPLRVQVSDPAGS